MTETVEERARHLLMPFRDDIITCQKRFKTLQSGIAQALRTERDKALEEAAAAIREIAAEYPPGYLTALELESAATVIEGRNLKSKSE